MNHVSGSNPGNLPTCVKMTVVSKYVSCI